MKINFSLIWRPLKEGVGEEEQDEGKEGHKAHC